jgi:hypothetical protein
MKSQNFRRFWEKSPILSRFTLIFTSLKDGSMPDDFAEPEVDSREAKIQRAIAISKHRHFDRYGISEADEPYIRSLPDWQLDWIIEDRST